MLPELSVASATMEYVPTADGVQTAPKGADVEVVPTMVPLTMNRTPMTVPSLSDAIAPRLTARFAVVEEPAPGLVSVTDGAWFEITTTLRATEFVMLPELSVASATIV